MLNTKSHREKDSLILVALICSLAGIAFMTIASHGYINAVTNNTSNTNNNNSTIHITATANNSLITNILAKNLENHIQKAGSILEITSKLLQVRDTSYAHLLNQTLSTLHGVPRYADTEKRQVAKNIIASNSDLYKIYFIMPNGDMYFLEPYSTQQTLTKNNYAFRDYFQGAIKTDDTYLGNVIIAAAASHPRESVIAVPVYSLRDNSIIAGVWVGSIDFGILNKELQSLNIISSSDSGNGSNNNNTRVVYVDSNGQKVADSDVNKSKIPESFAILNSFKSAINGQSGSTIDTVDNTKMLVTYRPVKAFHNTWVVLLMQPQLPQ